jgi:hypothetical protein
MSASSPPTPRGTEAMGDLATLLARREIEDCLLRYCWGIDRGDLQLVLSAFHDDARDNHGGHEESAVERFTRTVVEGGPLKTSHNLANVLIQIEAEGEGRELTAVSQSYFTARHQFDHDGKTWDWILAGRYLDRHARRQGRWGIVHRTVVYDFERFDEHGARPIGHAAEPFLQHVIRGEKSRNDYSYRLLAT